MKNTTTHPVMEVAAPSKVLMSASPSGQTIQVIEQPDGKLAIVIDGENPTHLRWGSHQVEACMRTYMRMLKR